MTIGKINLIILRNENDKNEQNENKPKEISHLLAKSSQHAQSQMKS